MGRKEVRSEQGEGQGEAGNGGTIRVDEELRN